MPRTVVLVFAEQYAGNPASLFGHVFLRLGGDLLQPRPLDSIVGFFADVPADVSALQYALKGLFGGFEASYVPSEYQHGLREYNDLENRGLWEYELAMTDAEIERLVLRIRASRDETVPYYFLTRNCAAGMLDLLELPHPARRAFFELPVDVVRALAASGRVRAVRYRPPFGARVEARFAQLDAAQRQAADELLDGSRTPAEVDDAAALEAAAESLAFAARQRRTDTPEDPRLSLLLRRRAALGGAPVTVEPHPPRRPDSAHPPTRLALGVDADGAPIVALRPGVHGLMDRSDGLEGQVEMEVLAATLRGVDLERLRLLSLRHLVPMTRTARRPAWGVRLDVARRQDDVCRAAEAEGQAGLAFGSTRLTGYLLAAARAEAGRCRGSLAAGGYVGFIVERNWGKTQVHAEQFR